MELFNQDSFGRDSVSVGKNSFVLQKIVPFEEWIAKTADMDSFMKLSIKDRKKIFLRWKWGCVSDDANYDLDISERQAISLFVGKDTSELEEGWRFYIENKINFDRVCLETQRRVGLIESKDPEVQKISQMFGARQI